MKVNETEKGSLKNWWRIDEFEFKVKRKKEKDGNTTANKLTKSH